MLCLLFLPLFVFSQKQVFAYDKTNSQKMAFGSQFYNFHTYEVVGVKYHFLNLPETPSEIVFVVTKDPNFTIGGKHYWDICYEDLPKEKQMGYSVAYGVFFADFGDGWFGSYGNGNLFLLKEKSLLTL